MSGAYLTAVQGEAFPPVTDQWTEWSDRGARPSDLIPPGGPNELEGPERTPVLQLRPPIIKVIQQRHASGQASSLQEWAVQLGERATTLIKFDMTLRATGSWSD